LHDVRVLVTRPEPDAEEQADELRALGVEPVCQPLMTCIDVPWDRGLLARAAGLIVTSRNALRQIGGAGAAIDLPVFAVGEATRAEAVRLGFRDVRVGEGTGEALARTIRETWRPGRPLLHLTGEHQAYPLAHALTGAGITVETVIAYRMEERRTFDPGVIEAYRRATLDGVILMSPRTACLYVKLCRAAGLSAEMEAVHAFCFSDQIARRLMQDAPAVPYSTAARPEKQALLDLVGHHANGLASCRQHN
jgi:uroporphyrinogen-III synthase